MSNEEKNEGGGLLERIAVLYEDADCVVVNKPSGLMVHSDGRAKGPFLTDWVVARYPETKDVGEVMTGQKGEALDRAGIVHRLDKETSGAIVVAKTTEAYASLKKQFKGRTIGKKYLALVWGELKEEFGTIKRPIGKNASDFRRFSAERGARGELREAETYWTKVRDGKIKTVSRGSGDGKLEPVTLVEVQPKTGRTHQIRVHFTAIHHPIVGDKLYFRNGPTIKGLDRTALHSASVEFDDLRGKRVKVAAPLPDDFLECLRSIC